MIPLVSVVIPTANRPHYLPRAVESALAGMVAGEVEVIVVPNGSDVSWKQSLLPYQNNPAVRAIPISEASANMARNTGLANARGEYIRFLDDDDYLIPEGSVKQYELLQSSGADLVSGRVQLIDEKGHVFNIRQQPETDDLCAAVLGPWRFCQPTAHVYKKLALENVKWNPNTKVHQDYEWFFNLCLSRSISWAKTSEIVGSWQFHFSERISTKKEYDSIRYNTLVTMILNTYEILYREKKINNERKSAVARGLWECVHRCFFREPSYWTNVANTATSIDPSAKPMQPIYHFYVINNLNPLFIQWIMFPKRWTFYKYMQLLKMLKIRHGW